MAESNTLLIRLSSAVSTLEIFWLLFSVSHFLDHGRMLWHRKRAVVVYWLFEEMDYTIPLLC
eukprot:m.284403 g.284403  ORF g.284403 m.284403 type:complete len:62 (+) comp40679_c0_seq34:1771-1956(+)